MDLADEIASRLTDQTGITRVAADALRAALRRTGTERIDSFDEAIRIARRITPRAGDETGIARIARAPLHTSRGWSLWAVRQVRKDLIGNTMRVADRITDDVRTDAGITRVAGGPLNAERSRIHLWRAAGISADDEAVPDVAFVADRFTDQTGIAGVASGTFFTRTATSQ